MERVSGPYKGYYIAAYTVHSGHNFVGYAKICMAEPDNACNAQSVERLTSATGYHSEQEALEAAENKARRVVADLVGAPVTAHGALN